MDKDEARCREVACFELLCDILKNRVTVRNPHTITLTNGAQKGFFGFYSKTAPFIDFTLSFHF